MKILITILITFLFCLANSKNTKPLYKCGDSKIKPIEITEANIIPSDKNYKPKRALETDQEGFGEFSIHLDLENFYYEVELYHLEETKELYEQGMKNAVKILQSLLRVKKVTTRYVFDDAQILNIFINKWDKTKIGSDLKEQNIAMPELGIDFYLFIRFGNNTEMGDTTLASASAKYLIPETGQPLIGVVNINRDVDYSNLNSWHSFQTTILHEFTHALGFSNYFFTKYYHNVFSKVDEYNVIRNYINSTKVLEVARNYFNCSSLEGVQLEESGGSGTVGSHWEARILLGDYMNGYSFNTEEVISEFTLALLEDSGYYKANYYTGGLMQYGKNKGCEFVIGKCVNNGTINPKFSNEFFDTIHSQRGNFDPSCSSSRQTRAYHIFYIYSEIPEQYKYFGQDNEYWLGGWSPADYCPISHEDSTESNNIDYVGHCSEIGSYEYGTQTLHFNSSGYSVSLTSGDLKNYTYEKLSNNSFCVLSSMIHEEVPNYALYTRSVRAICYEMHCSSRSLTIQINNDYIVCPREGGKVNATHFYGYLECPDYYLICSSNVLCNDLFDCVEKKSTLKDIEYDYEPKTTQDLDAIENENISLNAYELSNDGKCPQFCSQCNELGQCIKCKYDYGIVERDENNQTKRICIPLTELEIGYYKNNLNSIYYPCLDNCIKCSNGLQCEECGSGYVFKDDETNICYLNESFIDDNRYIYVDRSHIRTCSNIINNCEKCQKDENMTVNCMECTNNSYIVNDNYSECIPQNLIYPLEEYFLDQSKNTYYSCILYNDIINCKNCSFRDKCNLCKETYTFINSNKSICMKISELGNRYIQDEYDRTIYRRCNEYINNCDSCFEPESCQICEDQFGLFKDRNKCININDSHYFLQSNDSLYYFCNSSIRHCETCSNENQCLSCQEGYDLSNNICVRVIEHCIFYNLEEKCTNCSAGYKVSQDGELCIIKYPNCTQVDNEGNCISCIDGYRLSKNNCYKYITNCQNYETEGPNCSICNQGYAFVEGNKLECINKAQLEEYYTIDGMNYLLCNGTGNDRIQYCRKCNYEQSNGTMCTECYSQFILVDDENNKCYPKSQYENSSSYYYEDSFHLRKCSSTINKCLECQKEQEAVKCDKCESQFYFLDGDYTICKYIEEIAPSDEYIFDEGRNEYFSCINNNQVENCKKCHNLTLCDYCEDGYVFIGKMKEICKNKLELGKQYIQDENDTLVYIKCSEFMEHCDTCSTKDECLSCEKNFGVYEDKKQCVDITQGEYYKDKNNLYHLCNSKINNCEKCSSENSCDKCFDSYYRMDNDKSKCHNMADINTNEYYLDPKDDNMYLKCSSLISNCISCNSEKCFYCSDNYFMINDNFKRCYGKSEIKLDKYFTNDKIMYYSCEETRYKSNLQCFSLIEQKIELKFIQIQKKGKKLISYMLTHTALPKGFSLLLKILIILSKRGRILEEETEMVFNAQEDADSSEYKIISFVSEEDSEGGEAQVMGVQINDKNNITKTAIENNKYNIDFDGDSDYTNTAKVQSLINENKIIDCSKIAGNDIVEINMDKVEGCEFQLIYETPINLNDGGLDVELVAVNNISQNATAKCNNENNELNSLTCKVEDYVNNDFALKYDIIQNKEKLIKINPVDNNRFKLVCEKEPGKDNKKLIIIIIVCCGVGLIIFINVIICACRNKKYKDVNQNNNEMYKEKNEEDNKFDSYSKRGLNLNINQPKEEMNPSEQILRINKSKKKSKSIFNKKK